nr:collagen alpha-1(I) chain-like [Globicephala melas]
MGKHTAHWSVRGHSLGGTTSAAPQARPPGSGRGEHAREARQTPPSRRPRPNTIAPTPVCDSPHTRKWGRRHTRRRPGHEVSPPHGTPWEDDGDEVAGPRPPPRERNRGKTPRPLPSRPPRESHSRDTPPRRRPRGARWEKGTTPPLGLAHLRDDLERSRGTTEDRASHAHAPAAGARRSGGTAPTDAGRTAREAHAKEAKRERLLRPRTTAPPTPPGPGERDITTSISQSREPGATRAPREEGHGEDPHRRSLLQPQPAPSPPLLSLLPSRATVADDPARRTPDTWHGACGLGSSQPPPGACGGEGESHGVEDPRTTSPRRPRVSQRPEAAPRVGSAGRTHESRRAGPSGRLKWQGPVRAPDGGPKPSALRASRVPEPPARDARGDRVSTYLVVKKAHFRRKKSRRPAAGPIHEPRGGSPGPRPGYLSPTLPHPQQPRSSLGAIWSTRAAGAAEWSGAGRENVAEAASGPGSPSPDRPREQVPYRGPSESPGEDLVTEKELSHSAASDERGPRGTAPGPRPPYPGHPVRLGPVPTATPTPAGTRGGGGGGGGAGCALPGHPREQVPARPRPRTQGDLETFSHGGTSQATGAHEGPHPGPGLSLRVTPRGPARSPPPESDSEKHRSERIRPPGPTRARQRARRALHRPKRTGTGTGRSPPPERGALGTGRWGGGREGRKEGGSGGRVGPRGRMLVDQARRPHRPARERGDSHTLIGLHAQSQATAGGAHAWAPPGQSPPASPGSRNSASGPAAESQPSRRSPKLQRQGTI